MYNPPGQFLLRLRREPRPNHPGPLCALSTCPSFPTISWPAGQHCTSQPGHALLPHPSLLFAVLQVQKGSLGYLADRSAAREMRPGLLRAASRLPEVGGWASGRAGRQVRCCSWSI